MTAPMANLHFDSILTGEFGGWLLHGFVLSLELTLVTFVLALPLGVAVALLRSATHAAPRIAGAAYVESIRNVPLLAHLMFWYFGAPLLLPDSFRNWLYEHNAESVCAVIALTLYTAAFMAGDIRSGLRAIPRTQLEAARALGLGFLAAYRLVVLPQALRVSLPPLLSQTLNLWKNTSIATVIGTAELMYQAQRVETASFRATETFLVVTLAYLLVSLSITALGVLAARRVAPRVA